MLDRTDRHWRFMLRQISRQCLLYTEMITTAALIHGDRERLLGFDPQESPLILQLGGDDPQQLAACARLAAAWGYAGVNLNVGCPSDRVQNGHFGACLMAEPARVGAAVAAMQAAVDLPISVKHRIGIDDRDRYSDLHEFVRVVRAAGCRHFSVHARKAWLQGLSPKDNRTIPPLRYSDVYQLKQDFPDCWLEINGGITTWAAITEHHQHVDSVMIGRAVYDDPFLFAPADAALLGRSLPAATSEQVIAAMIPYIETWVAHGGRPHSITRHMVNLRNGQPGAKVWRRRLSAIGQGQADWRAIEAWVSIPA
ncbi:MAG: tRNA dihydrouridine(20/20a) synthase DusA [Synechococcaceae cyanobacterium SM2_3_60]|nr:tRNA dihydrouridine(20/20a) synthase DusA [Synechococcaceae cyanobacterium SM2_3_60]